MSDSDEVKLSPQQWLILNLVGEGLTNKMIASKLDITQATVKTHMKQIFRKLPRLDNLRLGSTTRADVSNDPCRHAHAELQRGHGPAGGDSADFFAKPKKHRLEF